MRYSLLFLLNSLFCSANSLLAQPLSANQLIQETIATYQKTQSYQDEGVVVVRYKSPKSTSSNTIKFKTQFDRTKSYYSFQCQWQNSNALTECYAITTDNKLIRSLARISSNQTIFLSNQEAISRASEFSAGASYKILSLLLGLPTDSQWNIKSIANWDIKEPIQLNNTQYHRLKGQLPEANIDDLELLIDQNSHLVKRVVFHQKNSGDVLTVIDYSIATNQPIKPIQPISQASYCLTSR